MTLKGKVKHVCTGDGLWQAVKNEILTGNPNWIWDRISYLCSVQALSLKKAEISVQC